MTGQQRHLSLAFPAKEATVPTGPTLPTRSRKSVGYFPLYTYTFGNGGATDINCCIERQDDAYLFTTSYFSFRDSGKGQPVILTDQQVESLYQSLLAAPEPWENYSILPLSDSSRLEAPGDYFASLGYAFEDGHEPVSLQVLDTLDALWMELLKESYSQADLDILSFYIK